MVDPAYYLVGALAVSLVASVTVDAVKYQHKNVLLATNQCEVTDMRITDNYVREHRITEKDEYNILLDPPVTMEYEYECTDGSTFWKEI